MRISNKTTPYDQLKLALKFKALKININATKYQLISKEELNAKEAFLEDFYLELDESLSNKEMNMVPQLQ